MYEYKVVVDYWNNLHVRIGEINTKLNNTESWCIKQFLPLGEKFLIILERVIKYG